MLQDHRLIALIPQLAMVIIFSFSVARARIVWATFSLDLDKHQYV